VTTENPFDNDSGGSAEDRPVKLPMHMVEVVNRLMWARRRLLHELGREPTVEEMAKRVDLSTERVRELLRIIDYAVPVGERDEFIWEPRARS
jgi:RNA polymerase primary sigma factor